MLMVNKDVQSMR